MNALGLPGASIDGILGFTILARFRLEIDLTKDRMTWTRLDHDPRDPPVPRHKPGEASAAPAGVQAMSLLGPLAKGLAFLMGKQPEEECQPRGFLGLEWSERVSVGTKAGLGPERARRLSRPLGGGFRPATRSFGSMIESSRALKMRALPWPRFILVNRCPWSFAAARVTDARELRLTLTAGEGL